MGEVCGEVEKLEGFAYWSLSQGDQISVANVEEEP